MIRKILLTLLSISWVSTVSLTAQEAPDQPPENENGEPKDDDEDKKKPDDAAGPDKFWQAKLGAGLYMVSLDRITSLSRHQYLLDGALIIDEVTVDSSGQALARFYHIKPITAALPGNTAAQITKMSADLIGKVTDRADVSVQNMVIKKYPITTHARSIEYRILSESNLTALFKSVQTAWETGRGRIFTVK